MEITNNQIMSNKNVDFFSNKNSLDYAPHQAGGHKGSIVEIDGEIYKRAKKSEIEFYKWLYDYKNMDSKKLNDQSLFTNQRNNSKNNINNQSCEDFNCSTKNSVENTKNNCDMKVKKHTQVFSLNKDLLKNILPRLKGIKTIDNVECLNLENLNEGYDNANLIDLKLGKCTSPYQDSPEKFERKKYKNSFTTSVSLGFRVSGVIILDEAGKTTLSLQKIDAKYSINKDNIKDLFAMLITKNSLIQKNLLPEILKETKKILHFFKTQKEKKFFASSLYYVFGKNNKFQVRYIDMAYPYDTDGEFDYNTIEGIEGVISVWESLYDYEVKINNSNNNLKNNENIIRNNNQKKNSFNDIIKLKNCRKFPYCCHMNNAIVNGLADCYNSLSNSPIDNFNYFTNINSNTNICNLTSPKEKIELNIINCRFNINSDHFRENANNSLMENCSLIGLSNSKIPIETFGNNKIIN